MFLEPKICMFKLFLKRLVRTEIVAAKNSALPLQEKKY